MRLSVEGLDARLEFRPSPFARRLSLRVDPATGAVVVTGPPSATALQARRFVAAHADWIRRRRAAVPLAIPFADGAVVPYLGADHTVRHTAEGRGVRRADGRFLVGGPAAAVPRRLRAFLVDAARREMTGRAAAKAARLGRTVAGIGIRDPRSRWGSCSAEGHLSFSWRLILAPEPVLDYVVAHEVAHLVEMNHGPRFHALVARLTPEPAAPRTWLRRHGAGLYRYGGPPA